ncbi:MAG TPA: ABC-F family ATP-binding cassette domain-containing protein [Acidimicrobiales bacterium]|nr:ABC-F family ATP-binding cassette domain-containing protein [Acidimicrobiales bacterium]
MTTPVVGDAGGVLQARALTVEVAGRVILDNASITVRAGDKVGLVGRNGAGKTSLLRVLAGDGSAAHGVVSLRGALGYLAQEPRPADEETQTALSHVLAGRELDVAAARLEKLRLQVEEDASAANVARFTRAEDAFSEAGGYAAEPEARRIAHGLGLAADRLDRPLGVLSGGERRRVELARILFSGSDLLLLDEPTNHLDNDAKSWLMTFLRGFRGALLVVSHDLELLDTAITRVLHLDAAALAEYKGTYSQYREQRRLDEMRLGKLATRQQAEIKRLRDLADSLRHGSRARKAKSLDTTVAHMEARAVTGPKAERSVSVRFPTPPHSGKLVLTVEELAKAYGGPPVFEDVSFILGNGERLLVLGLNGAGKTSLLRILAGVTTPDGGAFKLGAGVALGYYAQEHEGIRSGVAVIEHIQGEAVALEQQRRGLLGMFGLTGEVAFQDAGTLSGGEKTKLALAQLVAGRCNLLLLDEPTNNLDPPSRAAVGTSLASWPGSMVIVSHDPEFVQKLQPDRVLLMPDGALDDWSDDLLDLVALA